MTAADPRFVGVGGRAICRAAARAGMPPEVYLERRAAGEKYCAKCRAWKLKTDFHANTREKDGRRPTCRVCLGVQRSERRRSHPPAPKTRRSQRQRPPRGDAPDLVVKLLGPRELYRQAKNDPARIARFAARQAEILKAHQRVIEMAEYWEECRLARGQKARGPRIAVGRNAEARS